MFLPILRLLSVYAFLDTIRVADDVFAVQASVDYHAEGRPRDDAASP